MRSRLQTLQESDTHLVILRLLVFMYSHRGQTMPSKHVAFVGVTGVGKSTLVNMLVGPGSSESSAEVNNDAEPCTIGQHPYDTEFEETRFTLWDTRGLNEPREQAAKSPLARLLEFFGITPSEDKELQTFLCGKNPAINLVIFCIEAKDIRGCSQWKHYGKVYKEFCKKRVKIVVVVTKLDQETDWEETCMLKAKEVVKGSPNLRGSLAAVPTFKQKPPAEDMQLEDCRNKILKFISSSIR